MQISARSLNLQARLPSLVVSLDVFVITVPEVDGGGVDLGIGRDVGDGGEEEVHLAGVVRLVDGGPVEPGPDILFLKHAGSIFRQSSTLYVVSP